MFLLNSVGRSAPAGGDASLLYQTLSPPDTLSLGHSRCLDISFLSSYMRQIPKHPINMCRPADPNTSDTPIYTQLSSPWYISTFWWDGTRTRLTSHEELLCLSPSLLTYLRCQPLSHLTHSGLAKWQGCPSLPTSRWDGDSMDKLTVSTRYQNHQLTSFTTNFGDKLPLL